MKLQPPKFPLFMGIIAILIIVPLTIYLVLQRTQLLSEAGANDEPKFITVANETDDGFTIAWVTTKATQGSVILPFEGLTIPGKANTKTHVIEVSGLEAGKRYLFKLLSGTVSDDNQGAYYEAFTSKIPATQDNQLIFGRIFGKESTTPLQEGFVTLFTETGGVRTNKIISRLNEQGGWQMDKSMLLNNSLTQPFDYTQKSLVTVTINSPEITEPVTRTYDVKLSETLQVLDIFIGENVPWELPAIEDESITTTE